MHLAKWPGWFSSRASRPMGLLFQISVTRQVGGDWLDHSLSERCQLLASKNSVPASYGMMSDVWIVPPHTEYWETVHV